MSREDKITRVADYLQSLWPDSAIVPLPKLPGAGEVGVEFRIDAPDTGEMRHRIMLTFELVDKFPSPEELVAQLERWQMKEELKRAGQNPLVVTPAGIQPISTVS